MKSIKITFVDEDGAERLIKAPIGLSILEVAHQYDIDLEGACEGSLACSTCHVVIDKDYYDLLPEPSTEEEDMLDLAFNPTNTSRLGCQIIMSEELDGMKITVPSTTRNINL